MHPLYDGLGLLLVFFQKVYGRALESLVQTEWLWYCEHCQEKGSMGSALSRSSVTMK